ncbi:hypothetical protein [Paenibacillus hamazuiensis]|uniref:hypothetical protein n=1 Tax=Paenibacillus hamazuiensis TaxID=2936508 RepID=UPI00200FAEA3|nr:hypothetical protein [Paenibacillus hamazuiensis]
MNSMEINFELAKTYAPLIYFDEREPFFPVMVGISHYVPGEASASFRRVFEWDGAPLRTIMEYAIYWDYDIQHLYELEHVWIYVGESGEVLDCEASFHGSFFKGLLKDRSNLEGNQVKLYSQPGKHAFMPHPDYFQLLPNLVTCTSRDAGTHGMIITDVLKGRLESTPLINRRVEQYLRTKAFIPSMIFNKYVLEDSLYVSWPELWRNIPVRILDCLRELGCEDEIISGGAAANSK